MDGLKLFRIADRIVRGAASTDPATTASAVQCVANYSGIFTKEEIAAVLTMTVGQVFDAIRAHVKQEGRLL